jgi:hypothetical protein
MQTNPAKELRLTQIVASLTKIDANPAPPLRTPHSASLTQLNALLTDIDACVAGFNGLFNARNSKINTY